MRFTLSKRGVVMAMVIWEGATLIVERISYGKVLDLSSGKLCFVCAILNLLHAGFLLFLLFALWVLFSC
jgi:hypothetical protein